MNSIVNLSGSDAAKVLGVHDNIWAPGFDGRKMTFKGAAIFLEALAHAEFKNDKPRRSGETQISHMAEAAAPFPLETTDHYARRAIGWAHDLAEEKPYLSLDVFRKWGIPERIVQGIHSMTREVYDSYKDKNGKPVEIHEPYLDGFRKLLRNPDAAEVKLKGDMPSNMRGYTNGNKLFVYQIAMAYGIAYVEGIITPDCLYKDFFRMIKFGETGNRKLDDAIAIVDNIPPKKLNEVLRDECSEYGGRAADITNYYSPSRAGKVLQFSRRVSWKARSVLVTSSQAMSKVAHTALKSAASLFI